MKSSIIEFITPPLVEGPKIIFFVPLPESLKEFPLAMQMSNGNFGLPVTITVVTTWFLIFLMFVVFKLGTRKLEIVPNRFQMILEIIYNFLDMIMEQILGPWKKKYFVFLGTMFLFIITSNIISFFPIPFVSFQNGIHIEPAFRSPTADLNTTVGLAVLSTIAFVGTSIRYNGLWGYLKGFASPFFIMLPLNIVGEMAKPINISIRLFGNMFAGGVIIGLMYMALPWALPVPLHLYFDLFSGLVQSFVFVSLTMVYIKGSIGDTEYIEEK